MSIPLDRQIAVSLTFLVIPPWLFPTRQCLPWFTSRSPPVQTIWTSSSEWSFCNCRWDRNRLSSALVLRYYQWILCSPIWPGFRFDRCTFIYPLVYSWFHLLHALADILECHQHPVTFPSSMRTKPYPILWVGVAIRPWNHTNPNGDPNHDHNPNPNPNPNSPNLAMANAEPFANKFEIRRSTESVLRLLFCALVYKYLLVDLDIVTLSTSYPVIFTFALSPSCFASNLIYKNWGFNRVILIPLSQRTFFELQNRSTLSCSQDFSAELNVCEHHCSRCVFSCLNLQHIHQYKEQE